MVTAIVLAGGTGTRVGAGVPKQFVEVMGKPILAYTLDIFQENRSIDSIEIVCHRDWIDEANRIVRENGIDKTRWVCEGGDTFQGSVLNGVMNLEGKLADDDIVVITFGAAPMTPQEDIDDSIRVCRLHGNGIASADISLCTCIKDDEGSSTQNNIHSLYTVRDRLGGTYICNCDNYFEENPFSPYEYNSFHATVCKEDASDELVVRKNESGRILEVFSCAKSGECIYGHAFMDAAFASRFVRFMEEEEHDFRISQMFWEEFVSRHVDDLDMYVHEYPADMVYEFDHIQEIQNIEGLFLGNVSGRINGIICKVLECTEEEISDINVLEKGLSNILFTFVVRGERYIFRYPGDSTAFFIYRKNECVAQKLGAISHADDTYVYIDEEGNKISKFRENVKDIHGVYYEDVELMRRVARKIWAFHDAGRGMEDWEQYDYDPIYQTERLFKEASKIVTVNIVFANYAKMLSPFSPTYIRQTRQRTFATSGYPSFPHSVSAA